MGTPETTAPAGATTDGRVARGERNRQAIVDAFLRLVGEGGARVTGAQVAEAAGVSARSLWTHFADLEALYDAAAVDLWGRYLATHTTVATTGPFPERLAAWCAQRAVELEELAPYAAAAALQEPFSPGLRTSRRRYIDLLVREVGEVFDPELTACAAAERRARHDAVVALSSYPAWSLWRHDLGLGVMRSRAALQAAVGATLAG